MRRRNPQADAATRRIQKESIDALRAKVMRTDARNMGVAGRLTMPEVRQATVIDVQDENGDLKFTWGYSRWGKGDVWAE